PNPNPRNPANAKLKWGCFLCSKYLASFCGYPRPWLKRGVPFSKQSTAQMSRIAGVTGCSAVLLGGPAFPPPSAAQSAVKDVSRPSTPYVPLYSPCRAVPPRDPVAQVVFEALWPAKGFQEFSRQLDSLRV